MTTLAFFFLTIGTLTLDRSLICFGKRQTEEIHVPELIYQNATKTFEDDGRAVSALTHQQESWNIPFKPKYGDDDPTIASSIVEIVIFVILGLVILSFVSFLVCICCPICVMAKMKYRRRAHVYARRTEAPTVTQTIQSTQNSLGSPQIISIRNQQQLNVPYSTQETVTIIPLVTTHPQYRTQTTTTETIPSNQISSSSDGQLNDDNQDNNNLSTGDIPIPSLDPLSSCLEGQIRMDPLSQEEPQCYKDYTEIPVL